ncbi:MAG: phage holin family protein [Fusobacteriaceae bacterium]
MISLAKGYLAMIYTSWVSLVIYLIGGFDNLFRALLVMMALDYLTGLIKGYKKKNINSKTAYKGFWKKLVVLFIVVAATQMDMILQNMGIRTLVLMFYVATEFLSIIENAATLGVPIPEKLKSSLEQCRENKKIEEV